MQEEATVPGDFPGIYACDYKKLAQIMVKTAEARLALMQGDTSGAEVGSSSEGRCALVLQYSAVLLCCGQLLVEV